MALQEKISQDLKESQLKRDELGVSVLRMALAALHNKEIEKRTKLSKTEAIEKLEALSRLSDEEVLEIMASEAKKRRESIALFKQGNRQDLAGKEEKELAFLEKYLPSQFSESELKEMVKAAVVKAGAASLADIGKVMGILAPQTKNRADGSQVSRLVKEALPPGV